jgi:hypothetical protein
MFAALAVIACALAVLWLWAVPTALHSSTFAVIAAFAIGGTAVSLLTWRNAQATSTIAQVLHDTEMAGRRGPVSR